MSKVSYFFLFLVSLSSCSSSSDLEYEQYLVNGEILYKNQCANCHGQEGEGLRQLYPALNDNAVLADQSKVVCLIKNGIRADQSSTKQAMPGNSDLFDLDIAQLVTYLNAQFSDTEKKVSADEVKAILKDCD
ncbi:c-type cytochrome [Jiulongibacter sp. NS-SX5]|uniref:c-type cytochrome n=1 Tax=Jiulongibacter sp. NS-SX5 TaxID=3463854 RepID=UPI004058B6E5